MPARRAGKQPDPASGCTLLALAPRRVAYFYFQVSADGDLALVTAVPCVEPREETPVVVLPTIPVWGTGKTHCVVLRFPAKDGAWEDAA
jgi:hypothetical protein